MLTDMRNRVRFRRPIHGSPIRGFRVATGLPRPITGIWSAIRTQSEGIWWVK